MKEPTPEIMRDVTARLTLPDTPGALPRLEPASARGGDGRPGALPLAAGFGGQHFDIFAREEIVRPSGWAVCWSDLMMTMFVMFAALYAFQMPVIQYKSVSELAVQAAPLGKDVATPQVVPGSILDRVFLQLSDLIERDGLGSRMSVRIVPEKSLHLVCSGDLLFEPGAASLKPEAQQSLRSVAVILRGAPQVLSVVGHCASDEPLGVFADPWALSVARASSVAKFLMADGQLPAGRFLVAGYGAERPLNASARPWSNRRVELVLSMETPTEPLPNEDASAPDGFRHWVAASQRGGE